MKQDCDRVESIDETRWDAFISYSRQDSSFAKYLVGRLDRQGLEAWIDVEDIPPAQIWRDELRRAIISSHSFIFVISPMSLKSRHCTQELEVAREHRKHLVPLLWRAYEEGQLAEDSPLLESQLLDFTEVGDDLQASQVDPLVEQLAAALRDEYNWRRQGTEYLVRAEVWRTENGPFLHRTELDGAHEWIRKGARMMPGPSELQIDYIHGSGDHHLAVAQSWQALYRKTKARQLSAQARQRVFDTPDLALLLAAEAHETQDLPQTRRALLHCLGVHRRLVTTLHELQAGKIRAVAISPDRSRLAATDIETLMVWDLQTFESFRRIDVSFDALTFGASADELILAKEGTIKIAGIQPGNLTGRDLAGHNARIYALACDPIRHRLASGDSDGQGFVWDLTDGERIEFRSDGPIHQIAWMPDGKSLVSCEGAMLRARPVEDPDQVTFEFQFEGDVAALDASPTGSWIVAAGPLQGREQLLCIDTLSGQSRLIPSLERQWLFRDLRFTHDNLFVTAGGGAKHAFSFGFDMVGSASGIISNLPRAEENIAVWQIESGIQPDSLLSGSTHEVSTIARSPDGDWVAAGGYEKKVYVWAPRTLSCLPSRGYETERPVVCVTTSSESDELAAAHADGAITLLSIQKNGTSMRTFHTESASIQRLVHRNNLILGLGGDDAVAIWETGTGREITRQPSPHQGAVSGLAWSPNRRFAATCGNDGAVLLLDGETLERSAHLQDEGPTAYGMALASPGEAPGPPQRWPFSCVLFSHDEKFVYAGTEGGQVLAWNTESGSQQSLDIKSGPSLNDLALSPDGACLVGVTQNMLVVWDLNQPEVDPEERSGHTDSILYAVFHPDGSSFVSCAKDGLLLWLREESEPLGWVSITHGAGPIVFSHDGELLVRGDGKGGIITWSMDPEKWIHYAQSKAHRSLNSGERAIYLDAEPEPDLPD